jgi:hypothetical protein
MSADTVVRLLRLYLLFGIAFVLIASQSLSIPARAADRAERERIEVLYSAEDNLCHSLGDLLNRLHARYPKATYLSEVRVSAFRGTGLRPPPWVEPTDPWGGPPEHGFPERRPGFFFRANVTGDGQKRVVYVRDYAIGHYGSYTTEVWILKPGMDYREKSGLDTSRKEMVTDVDPEVVDLLVAFYERDRWRPFQYPYVKGPDHRIGFPAIPRPSQDAEKYLRLLFASGMAQEPFSFSGRIYFSAGVPLRGYSLVYRITPAMTAEAVCMTATHGDLDYLRKLQ